MKDYLWGVLHDRYFWTFVFGCLYSFLFITSLDAVRMRRRIKKMVAGGVLTQVRADIIMTGKTTLPRDYPAAVETEGVKAGQGA
jgi:hypothetical protein